MKAINDSISTLLNFAHFNKESDRFTEALVNADLARSRRPVAIAILSLLVWLGFAGRSAAQGTPGFLPVANLNVARIAHTATLLGDGRVLIAGGGSDPYDGTKKLTSTELYDPVSRTFSTGSSLNNARSAHTATLLNDGRVLIAGGGGPTQTWSSAELFDPASGSLTLTGPMIAQHGAHTATLLTDGRVLIVGGGFTVSGAQTLVAELYNPATGQFSATGSLNQWRFIHTATLLNDGRVLIAGGATDRPSFQVLNTAEIFDPATGQFTMVPGQMVYARQAHSAVRLPNGTVLLAGGQMRPGVGPGYLANIAAEIFDPNTGNFSTTGAPLEGPRAQASLTVLNDGRVLLAGGYFVDFAALTEHIFASAELYDPSTGVFSSAGSLILACDDHRATKLTDGSVLLTGGNGYGPTRYIALAQAEIFRECQSAPTITAPSDVLVNTDLGQCQASHVSLGMPTTADNCGVASIANDAPLVFPKGSTVVTWTATDTFGVTATCKQNVTVIDKEPPTITCPANISIGCNVDLLTPVSFTATATDNCDPSPALSYSPASGSGFPTGTTPVTCTATDSSGNQSTCTFTVTRAPLGFAGFLSPIGGADAAGGSFASPIRTFKLNSTIPVKFTAGCGGSPVVTGVHRLEVIQYTSQTNADPPIDATPTDAATTGDQFQLNGSQWQFNLDTKATGMTGGKWLLQATLSDGSQHTAWIQLK